MASYHPVRRRPLQSVGGPVSSHRKWDRVWTILRKITLGRLLTAIILVLLILLLIDVAPEITGNVLVVDPITVPKSLSDTGLSSDALANRIGQKLEEIESTTKTRMNKDTLATETDQISIPEIEVPGTTIGLKTIVETMRVLLHRHPRHVTGDIVLQVSKTGPPEIDDSERKTAILTVYLKNTYGTTALSERVDIRDTDGLVRNAAELTLRQANPYLLAVYSEQNHELDTASKLAEAIVQDNSQDPPHKQAALVFLSGLLFNEHKYDEARAKAQEAVTSNPKDAYAYGALGRALAGQGKYIEAANAYRRATELDGKFSEAFTGWGMSLGYQGEYEEAIKKFRKAIELDPKSPDPYYDWGIALGNEHNPGEAIPKFEKATELNPEYAYAYLNWGTALSDQNRFDEATIKFQKAIEVDPKNAASYNAWGRALMKQGKLTEAIFKFSKAVELDPNYALAYANWGQVLCRERLIAGANEKLAKAAETSKIEGPPIPYGECEFASTRGWPTL